MEFGLQSLNSDTKNFLEQVYGLKNILLHNTMFPQYAKFETVERRNLAAQVMLTGEGDIHSALIFPKNKSGSRYLRYFLKKTGMSLEKHIGIDYIRLGV